jgi:hypothetical protein
MVFDKPRLPAVLAPETVADRTSLPEGGAAKCASSGSEHHITPADTTPHTRKGAAMRDTWT